MLRRFRSSLIDFSEQRSISLESIHRLAQNRRNSMLNGGTTKEISTTVSTMLTRTRDSIVDSTEMMIIRILDQSTSRSNSPKETERTTKKPVFRRQLSQRFSGLFSNNFSRNRYRHVQPNRNLGVRSVCTKPASETCLERWIMSNQYLNRSTTSANPTVSLTCRICIRTRSPTFVSGTITT